MDKDYICDLLLKQFEGNKSFSWEELHKESFYGKVDENYFVVENYIKYLIGENMLKEYLHHGSFYVSLTEKGWFVMTNFETDGYVSKRALQNKIELRDRQTLKYAKWATIISGVTLLTWLIDKLYN